MSETVQDLIDWARSIGAEEFGVYFVVAGQRIVVPVSLTEDELPAPTTEPEPRCADPRPE